MSSRSASVTAFTLVLLAFATSAFAQTPVADAAMRRDLAEVRRLIENGADVKAAQADGATALHWAAYHGDAALASLLLDAGADAAAANRNGSTPMWLAASHGDAAVIKALLEKGGDANEPLPLGRTPLMLAARSGSVDAVRALLEHGADPNAKESARGTTALMQAADQGHADVLEVLIEHGADAAATSAPVLRDARTAALGKSDDPRAAVREPAARARRSIDDRGSGARAGFRACELERWRRPLQPEARRAGLRDRAERREAQPCARA
jgi:ankyrin repeat protein